MNTDNYKNAYYNYQTKARGLLEREALQKRFEKSNKWYSCRLRKWLPSNPSAGCLELGCGYGNFLYFLRYCGYKNIIGYDLDQEQINLAKLLNLPAYKGNAFDVLDSKTEKFDCIAAIDLIEHLSRDEAMLFLKMCWQRLNSGGVLILRAPCADGPFGSHDRYNDLTHEWALTSNLLRTLFEMHNFERIVILDERPQPYNLINAFRLIIYHLARPLINGTCFALGVSPPAIWSRAMWGIAYKTSKA